MKRITLPCLLFVSLVSGCNSAADESSVVSEQTEAAASSATLAPAPEPHAVTTDIPAMQKGEAYSSIRQKLINSGWEPLTAGERDQCGDYDDRCSGRPEMVSCASSGQAQCKFSWKIKNRSILICTTGEAVKFDSICGDEIQPKNQAESSKAPVATLDGRWDTDKIACSKNRKESIYIKDGNLSQYEMHCAMPTDLGKSDWLHCSAEGEDFEISIGRGGSNQELNINEETFIKCPSS